MPEQNVVAIGASAGGISALRRLLAMIPHDLNAAVFLAYIVRRSRGARAQIRSASFASSTALQSFHGEGRSGLAAAGGQTGSSTRAHWWRGDRVHGNWCHLWSNQCDVR